MIITAKGMPITAQTMLLEARNVSKNTGSWRAPVVATDAISKRELCLSLSVPGNIFRAVLHHCYLLGAH